jgi:hypothetical protein
MALLSPVSAEVEYASGVMLGWYTVQNKQITRIIPLRRNLYHHQYSASAGTVMTSFHQEVVVLISLLRVLGRELLLAQDPPISQNENYSLEKNVFE